MDEDKIVGKNPLETVMMRAKVKGEAVADLLSLSPKSPKSLRSLKKLTFDRSFVTFRKLKEEDIRLYLSITEYTRNSGSYAVVASPQNFITKIEGSLSNVIGLPLEKVIPVLRKLKLLD